MFDRDWNKRVQLQKHKLVYEISWINSELFRAQVLLAKGDVTLMHVVTPPTSFGSKRSWEQYYAQQNRLSKIQSAAENGFLQANSFFQLFFVPDFDWHMIIQSCAEKENLKTPIFNSVNNYFVQLLLAMRGNVFF